MPMVDALAVWAEEGRVFKRENNDESFNRRYQSLVSEWGNPFWWKSEDHRKDLSFLRRALGELKHLSTRRKIKQ